MNNEIKHTPLRPHPFYTKADCRAVELQPRTSERKKLDREKSKKVISFQQIKKAFLPVFVSFSLVAGVGAVASNMNKEEMNSEPMMESVVNNENTEVNNQNLYVNSEQDILNQIYAPANLAFEVPVQSSDGIIYRAVVTKDGKCTYLTDQNLPFQFLDGAAIEDTIRYAGFDLDAYSASLKQNNSISDSGRTR